MAWVCWTSCCTTGSLLEPSPLPHLASGHSSASQTPSYALVPLTLLLPVQCCLLCHPITTYHTSAIHVWLVSGYQLSDVLLGIVLLRQSSALPIDQNDSFVPECLLGVCLRSSRLPTLLSISIARALHLHLRLFWKACSVSGLESTSLHLSAVQALL
jgi:hypothetical protein